MVQGFSNGFYFEQVVPVMSLLGYQTEEKVAARSGEGIETCAFL